MYTSVAVWKWITPILKLNIVYSLNVFVIMFVPEEIKQPFIENILLRNYYLDTHNIHASHTSTLSVVDNDRWQADDYLRGFIFITAYYALINTQSNYTNLI